MVVKLIEILGSWDKLDCVKFAVWCAKKSSSSFDRKYPKDKRLYLTIKAIENWLANPTLEVGLAAIEAGRFANSIDFSLGGLVASAAYSARAATYSVEATYTVEANVHFWAARAAYWTAEAQYGRSVHDLLDEYMELLEKNKNRVSLLELNRGL